MFTKEEIKRLTYYTKTTNRSHISVCGLLRDMDKLEIAFDEFKSSDVYKTALNENNYKTDVFAKLYDIYSDLSKTKQFKPIVISIGRAVRAIYRKHRMTQDFDTQLVNMMTDVENGFVVRMLDVKNLGVSSLYNISRILEDLGYSVNYLPEAICKVEDLTGVVPVNHHAYDMLSKTDKLFYIAYRTSNNRFHSLYDGIKNKEIYRLEKCDGVDISDILEYSKVVTFIKDIFLKKAKISNNKVIDDELESPVLLNVILEMMEDILTRLKSKHNRKVISLVIRCLRYIKRDTEYDILEITSNKNGLLFHMFLIDNIGPEMVRAFKMLLMDCGIEHTMSPDTIDRDWAMWLSSNDTKNKRRNTLLSWNKSSRPIIVGKLSDDAGREFNVAALDDGDNIIYKVYLKTNKIAYHGGVASADNSHREIIVAGAMVDKTTSTLTMYMVARPYRGAGVGKHLVNRIVKECNVTTAYVGLDNNKSIKTLMNCGFVISSINYSIGHFSKVVMKYAGLNDDVYATYNYNAEDFIESILKTKFEGIGL